MKKFFLLAFAVFMLMGCAAGQQGSIVASEASGGVNAFNPYLSEKLPALRKPTSEGAKILGSLGGGAQSIEGEAKYRKNWREEIYPVVFGDRKAPNEIIVVLNFSEPECEKLWSAVTEASKSLQPAQCKIVVYGKSDENYGMDLTGLAIWLSYSRKNQAMPWIGYALANWNAAKAAQKSAGKVKKFNNEYDSAPSAQEMPIMHRYLPRITPPVPANQELELARYCYNAGNVNMYQATQVCEYYGVRKLPAVIVNGKILSQVTPVSIIAALN